MKTLNPFLKPDEHTPERAQIWGVFKLKAAMKN